MDVAPQNIFSIDEMLRDTGDYVARAVPNAHHKVMQAPIFR